MTIDKPYQIVIVGGGRAGWLLACRIANHYLNMEARDLKIKVIESPDIAAIGVGEGSWPTMRKTLSQTGIRETDFLRTCGASFKQGTQFFNWQDDKMSGSYYHPFEPPRGHEYCNVGERWRNYSDRPAGDFSQVSSPQPAACALNLAPKTIATAEYQGVLNYGYHFDATAFANLLRTRATEELGVEWLQDSVLAAVKDDQGWIDALQTTDHGDVAGDFFIDCTGFHSLIVHQQLGVPYIDLQKYLFADRALAVQMPHRSEQSPIGSTTGSTAHDAGWIWDIPLRDRRGLGAVYSSAHMSDEQAYEVLQAYAGADSGMPEPRQIRFSARHLERFWEKNAVAVGLSSGFVEPLEASSLVLIESAADWFCNRLPRGQHAMELQARQYNQTFHGYWQQIVAFLKFHYLLSERQSDFWRDNRADISIPEGLQRQMALWQEEIPHRQDFNGNDDIFSWQSFQYVYLGMRAQRPARPWSMSESQRQLAQRDFELNSRISAKATQSLPSNRHLLAALTKHPFPTI